jgi:hypothetical protein
MLALSQVSISRREPNAIEAPATLGPRISRGPFFFAGSGGGLNNHILRADGFALVLGTYPAAAPRLEAL